MCFHGDAAVYCHLGLYGYQAIHAAAEKGCTEIFILLVNAGASLTLQDGVGQQPFHYAAGGGGVDVMKYLLTREGSKLLEVRPRAREQ